MATTAQMLADYDVELLEVIAEQRSASVEGGSRVQVIDALAAELTSPASVQSAYEDATDIHALAREAVEALLEAGGEMAEARFSKRFGSIRQMGPAKMRREAPWLHPESVAEVLFYLGLIGKTFRGAGQSAHTVIFLPSDIQAWIGEKKTVAVTSDFPLAPRQTPPSARAVYADDSFLEDAGSLLGFLSSDTLRLGAGGPNAEDIDRFVQRLQLPFDSTMPEQEVRLALLLHLANRLRWLKRGDGEMVVLTNNNVREFLEKTRAEQRQALFRAWHSSQEWNDLCRTPELQCGPRADAMPDGSPAAGVARASLTLPQNDPLQSRANVLALLAKVPITGWYSINEFVAWVREVEPNFQRPNGRHDEWAIRRAGTGELLTGLDKWDAVEGALLRFLIRGPLHWLGALDLAEPAAGDDWLMSLTSWGARWLDKDVAQPYEASVRQLTVREDFAIELPLAAPLFDRFRVERFAQWQSSYPQYVYQINQRSLKRAADSGLAPAQILSFLAGRTSRIPERVTSALQRLASTPPTVAGSEDGPAGGKQPATGKQPA
jgi:hypothetical protein